MTERAASADEARKREAANHPLVRAALEAFPGAKIAEVREFAPAEVGDADTEPEIETHKGKGPE